MASPASSHLPILAWFPRVRPSLSHAVNRLVSLLDSGCLAASTLPHRLSQCTVHGDFSSPAVPVFLPSFHVCALAIVFLGCTSGVTFWLCLLVLLLDHRLWWLALAAGCPCVLVRVLRLRRSWVLLLSSCSARGRCLLHLFLGFLLCLFLRLLQVSAACRAAGSLWRLLYLSGSSCLSCSCGGAMSVGFEVFFVRRLVLPCAVLLFWLRRFALLPLRPVTLGSFYPFWPRLPALLLCWWRELGYHPSLVFSGLHLLRLSC